MSCAWAWAMHAGNTKSRVMCARAILITQQEPMQHHHWCLALGLKMSHPKACAPGLQELLHGISPIMRGRNLRIHCVDCWLGSLEGGLMIF